MLRWSDPKHGPGYDVDRTKANRDIITVSDLMVDSFAVQPERILRPVFDMVWIAFGYPRSQNYDAEGNWHGQIQL